MCGRGSYNVDEEFLDLHRDIDDFGAIYFCLECGQEIGFSAGCSNPRDFAAISLANEQLTEENEKQNNMLERLSDGLERDILDYLSARGITVSLDGDKPVIDEDASEQDSGSNELFTDFYDGESGDDSVTSESVVTDEPEPTESSTVDGPDDTNESPVNDGKPTFSAIEL